MLKKSKFEIAAMCLLLCIGFANLVAQQSQAPLTNADVLRMLNSGVPESAILSSIQSSTARFDTSPDALLNLHRAGVGQKILDAMMAKGRTNALSPNLRAHIHKSNPKRDASEPMDAKQIAESKSKLDAQFAAFKGKLQLAHGLKTQAEVKKSPEIEALERQRTFIAAFRASNAKASSGLLSTGPTSAMSTNGGTLVGASAPGKTSAGAIQPIPSAKVAVTQTNLITPQSATTLAAPHPATASVAVAATQPVLATAATPQRQAPPSGGQHPATSNLNNVATPPVLTTTIPQEPSERQAPSASVQYQPVGTPNSKFSQMPVNVTICTTAQVYSVNNAGSGVVFTQDPAYNDYIISGRCFGIQGGEAYLSGAITGGRINMVVSEWGPNQIRAKVQPGLTGVLDGWPDLIVVPVGNPPIKFPNNRFYAQRQSVLLPSIPQNYARLANVQVGDSTHGFGTRYCPGPDLSHLFPCIAFNAGPPLDGISNGDGLFPGPNEPVSNAVDRDGGQLQFNSGEDVYDLSSLAPGFVIDDFYPNWYAWSASVCADWQAERAEKPGDSISYETNGAYNFYQKGSQIVVDWGVDHCKWRWLGMFNVDDEYNSGYSLQVHVKGPIGVDPWTGHATTSQ